ncbi:vacuolar protein sorting-associated protein VTA1 homolog isoform X2 [Aphidius gifuensis]|uniref:vacuolar protein sorting-associated protein VTA1 homolog isoform X2 n=1 Tax=Aphidius gifuensis TaxID=684658 RepID=UPI001CDB4A45|nr:vacuolar protein sorting-associated protein VTA1 homolog isoform X2 [Aphidius gifuensis]
MSNNSDKSNLQQRYLNIITQLTSTISTNKLSKMSSFDLSDLPATLKSIKPYLKTSNEHEVRDPVVSYWARLYALQTGIKIGKSPEERSYLMKLMDWLEKFKKEHSDNEAITNEIAAQAHLENWILTIFTHADEQDRAGNFSMSLVQGFYTAGILYDIMSTFGELTEEVIQNRKYAKWKATYIHNCLKNGQTPIAGPIENGEGGSPAPRNQEKKMNEEQWPDDVIEEDNDKTKSVVSDDTDELPGPANDGDEVEAPPQVPPNNDAYGFPAVPTSNSNVTPGNPAPSSTPSYPSFPASPSTPNAGYSPAPKHQPLPDYSTHEQTGNVNLDAEQMNKAQKYIKWAGSAINYDDIPTAVDNLRKALHLLTTGQDSG